MCSAEEHIWLSPVKPFKFGTARGFINDEKRVSKAFNSPPSVHLGGVVYVNTNQVPAGWKEGCSTSSSAARLAF